MYGDELYGPFRVIHFVGQEYFGINTFLLELLFWVLVILLTWALVRYRPALLEKVEERLKTISQHQRFWLVAFGLIVIVTRLSLLPLIPVPIPSVHDEFSFLLASDTFSDGRLTNPPSPMWQHFESFHMNVQPTYQSMYPPAQGLSLAFGQTIFGVPWAGVLIVTALLCSAIYWMLLGWLPAPWAWLGGAFAVVRYGTFSYWINSYWGGSLPALGGVLVLGAYPRFRQKPGVRMGLVMAVGLLILATSRPLEGFMFSLPILLAVAWILLQRAKIDWREALRVALPAVALLAAGAAWMLYYNWRGTGNPLVMPYEINWRTYHISRPFSFMAHNQIPNYHHETMRAYYVFHELPNMMIAKFNLTALIENRIIDYYEFFIWPFLLLLGPCLYAMWRSSLRVVLFSVAFIAAVLLPQIWQPQPHYASPATGAIVLALLFSVRHFRSSRSEYAIWGARALAMVFAVLFIAPIAAKIYDPYDFAKYYLQKEALIPLEIQRSRIEDGLEAQGGKHLVIVHYPSGDVPWMDWVYNRADIDHAPVIWARDMGYMKNKELVNYYKDRKVWYAVHGDPTGEILPYDQAMGGLEMAYDQPPADISLPPATKLSARAPSARITPPRRAKAELAAGASQ